MRVVNVVDSMALFSPGEHPHGMTDDAVRRALHRARRDVVFAFHGYPGAIHQLLHGRPERGALPRARLSRGGDDDDAVRHGRAQRDEPLPPRASRRFGGRGVSVANATQLIAECQRELDGTTPTSSSTSKTCPKSATGSGRRCRGPCPRPLRTPSSGAPVILCINGGSSSLKYALYRLSEKNETSLCEGSVLGMAQLPQVIRALSGFPAPHAIGHRVVHGGPGHQQAARIDAALLAELKAAIPFAPLHLPPELEAIEATLAHFPDVPQVVCFDTAFHRDLPEVAQRLPLPRPMFDRGIRRYGFHGLSYEYVVETLGAELGRSAIIAHLGGGSSLVALCNGAPIDTSMGLTPREGS